MNGIKLKPCPFCGGIGELKRKTECCGHGVYVEQIYVCCAKCGARGGIAYSWLDDNKRLADIAIERWERRATYGKQIDIFGNEVTEIEMLEMFAQERKIYKSMQNLYGEKEGFQCKTCKHCELHRHHGRNYYKCALWHISHSSATDIRLSATACNRYEGE